MVSEFTRRGSCKVIVILVCKFNFSMASFDIELSYVIFRKLQINLF